MRSPEQLSSLFRSRGLKVTPQRERIFRCLHGHTGHPTAESVFEEVRTDMPTISLRTVYQTLNDLAELGELTRIDLGTGSTRFDPTVATHHHAVCEGCGGVEDVYLDLDDLRLPPENGGFRVRGTEVVFRGLCRVCRDRSPLPTH